MEVNADVGLAFDGDGDRMGMVTNSAKFLPTDLYMILMIRDMIDKVEKKNFYMMLNVLRHCLMKLVV